jgi:hypothetical protein
MKVVILSGSGRGVNVDATVLGRLKGWLLGVLAMLAQKPLRCACFRAPSGAAR